MMNRKPSTGLLILLFLGIYIISQIIIIIVLGDAGHNLLKLQMIFSAEGFKHIIAGWENAGLLKNYYLHFIPDYLHPLWYSMFLYLLLKYLFGKTGLTGGKPARVLVFIGPVAGALDLIENTVHLLFLKFRNLITDGPVIAVSLVSALKWALAAAALLLALGLAFYLLVRKGSGREAAA